MEKVYGWMPHNASFGFLDLTQADCRGHLAWQAVSSNEDPYEYAAASSEGFDGQEA
jgi:hypothetical protein